MKPAELHRYDRFPCFMLSSLLMAGIDTIVFHFVRVTMSAVLWFIREFALNHIAERSAICVCVWALALLTGVGVTCQRPGRLGLATSRTYFSLGVDRAFVCIVRIRPDPLFAFAR